VKKCIGPLSIEDDSEITFEVLDVHTEKCSCSCCKDLMLLTSELKLHVFRICVGQRRSKHNQV
jgi:hypothetical protein